MFIKLGEKAAFFLILASLCLALVSLSLSMSLLLDKEEARNNLARRVLEVEDIASKIEVLHGSASDAHKRISGYKVSIEKKKGVLKFDSGVVSIQNKSQPELSNPSGCDVERGLSSLSIDFSSVFESIPEVFVVIEKIDFWHGTDHRLNVTARNVTNDSFVLRLSTWCDTKLSNVTAKWFAIGY